MSSRFVPLPATCLDLSPQARRARALAMLEARGTPRSPTFSKAALLAADKSLVTTLAQLVPSDPAAFLFAVADGGSLNVEALRYRTALPLERMLLCRTPSSDECWRVALEATESGLFSSGFVRATQRPSTVQLRRLQLAAERTGTFLTLWTVEPLPHWLCRRSHAAQEAHSHRR